MFEFLYYWTFEFVERILQRQNERFEEKQHHKHFAGMNKDAKFQPTNPRKKQLLQTSIAKKNFFN